MEEDKNNSGADVNNDEKDTEQEGADSKNSNGDNDGAGADGADDKGDKSDGSGDGDGDKDKSDKDKTNPDENEEPKTRKRNIDFILERKNNKIAKLAEKANKGNDDKGDDDEDEIDPLDETLISKVVDKKLKPLIDKQIAEEDENEINSFLKANPEFEKYAGKVRKFASHDSRKNIPIESIFYEVAGKDLMKIGAEKERKATKEAKDTTAGGGNNRNNAGGAKDVWSMTPEEFAAEQARIRSTPRD